MKLGFSLLSLVAERQLFNDNNGYDYDYIVIGLVFGCSVSAPRLAENQLEYENTDIYKAQVT